MSGSLSRVARSFISQQNVSFLRNRTSSGFLEYRHMSSQTEYQYETLQISRPHEYVVQVELNRPKKRNAINQQMYSDLTECFRKIADDADCRAVVLSGAGKIFSAGIDVMDLASALAPEGDVGRKAFKIRKFLNLLQESHTLMEKSCKPVIAAVHSACVGGGIDMTTACDIRYCTQDASFTVKEVDVGLAADLGTLQRLPRVMGNDSLMRELCFTSRPMFADEAKEFGLVSRIFPDRESLISGALELAKEIASKSPVAVQSTKFHLNFARGRPVEEGLSHIRTWNAAMLQSEDLVKAATAAMQKEKATFEKL